MSNHIPQVQMSLRLRRALRAACVRIAALCAVVTTGLLLMHQSDAREPLQRPTGAIDKPGQIVRNAHHERRAVLKLFVAKDWSALDARLQESQRLHLDGSIDGDFFADVLGAFRRDGPAVAKKIENWIAAMPNAWTAELAAGVYYHHLGWRSRGHRGVDRTVPEQVLVMRKMFKRAVAHFDRAIELNESLGPAYANLMDIAKTGIKVTKKRQNARADLVQVYERAIKAIPEVPMSYKVYIHCLSPRWGGTESHQVKLIKELKIRFAGNPRFRWLDDFVDSIEAGRQLSRGNFKSALALYETIIRRSNNTMAHMRRAAVLMHLKRPEDAFRALEAAAVARPKDPKPHFQMWMFRNQNGPTAGSIRTSRSGRGSGSSSCRLSVAACALQNRARRARRSRSGSTKRVVLWCLRRARP